MSSTFNIRRWTLLQQAVLACCAFVILLVFCSGVFGKFGSNRTDDEAAPAPTVSSTTPATASLDTVPTVTTPASPMPSPTPTFSVPRPSLGGALLRDKPTDMFDGKFMIRLPKEWCLAKKTNESYVYASRADCDDKGSIKENPSITFTSLSRTNNPRLVKDVVLACAENKNDLPLSAPALGEPNPHRLSYYEVCGYRVWHFDATDLVIVAKPGSNGIHVSPGLVQWLIVGDQE